METRKTELIWIVFTGEVTEVHGGLRIHWNGRRKQSRKQVKSKKVKGTGSRGEDNSEREKTSQGKGNFSFAYIFALFLLIGYLIQHNACKAIYMVWEFRIW